MHKDVRIGSASHYIFSYQSVEVDNPADAEMIEVVFSYEALDIVEDAARSLARRPCIPAHIRSEEYRKHFCELFQEDTDKVEESDTRSPAREEEDPISVYHKFSCQKFTIQDLDAAVHHARQLAKQPYQEKMHVTYVLGAAVLCPLLSDKIVGAGNACLSQNTEDTLREKEEKEALQLANAHALLTPAEEEKVRHHLACGMCLESTFGMIARHQQKLNRAKSHAWCVFAQDLLKIRYTSMADWLQGEQEKAASYRQILAWYKEAQDPLSHFFSEGRQLTKKGQEHFAALQGILQLLFATIGMKRLSITYLPEERSISPVTQQEEDIDPMVLAELLSSPYVMAYNDEVERLLRMVYNGNYRF